MNNILEHRGYKGEVKLSIEDGCLHGKVIGIHDVVSYEGENIGQIKLRFEEAVDDYIEFCLERGKEPNKPIYESLHINNLDLEVCVNIIALANEQSKSVSETVQDALVAYIAIKRHEALVSA